MKIIYFIGPLVKGGTELHVTNLAIKLKKKKITPIIFTMEKEDYLHNILKENSIKVLHSKITIKSAFLRKLKLIRYLNILLNFISMIFEIKKNKPNIVHFFLPAPYILGGLASIISGVSIKIMSRRSMNFYQKKFHLVHQIEIFTQNIDIF